MESFKTRKTAVLVIVVILLLSAAAAALWFLRLGKAPEPALSQFAGSDLPTLDLRLQFITTKGEEVPGEETRLAAGAPGAEADSTCPELTGGDIDDPTPRAEAEKPRRSSLSSTRSPSSFRAAGGAASSTKWNPVCPVSSMMVSMRSTRTSAVAAS